MKCWYCQVNEEDRADPYEATMYCVQRRSSETRYLGTHTTSKVEYLKETVRIPRCHACKMDERVTAIWAVAGGIVGLFIGGMLGNVLEHGSPFAQSEPGLLSWVAVVVGVIVGVYVALQIRNARAKGTRHRRIHDAGDFPRLQELKAAGWQSDVPSA